ncbi:MAG: hypothetical protein LBB59_05465, partial [Campylobacteraceae bacterium]|nr:hypothetical protein [Campylobacteraceae bacterium]
MSPWAEASRRFAQAAKGEVILIVGSGTDKDTLEGKGGNDTYYFFPNEGSDTVIDSGGEYDTLYFGEDITIDHLTATASENSNDLIINVKDKGTMITIKDWCTKDNRIEKFIFEDKTLTDHEIIGYMGTDEVDYIKGTEGQNKLEGKGGADILEGAAGNDLYIV